MTDFGQFFDLAQTVALASVAWFFFKMQSSIETLARELRRQSDEHRDMIDHMQKHALAHERIETKLDGMNK